MADTESSSDDVADDVDSIARGLRALRATAGGPSYAEIAQRIAHARHARGASPSAATPARTTVYDAFRDGRARINGALVREIVCALGATPAEADEWEARCGRAQRPTTVAIETVAPAVSARATPASAAPGVRLPTPRAATPTARIPLQPPTPRAAIARPLVVALVLAASVLLNLAGHSIVALLSLPLFLDMIGTAVVAVALGPWRAVLVAVASTLVSAAVYDETSLPFGLVNIAGALVWGYGVHRFGMGRSLARFFTLNVVAGVVCTVVAVPVLMLMFGGATGHASEDIAENLRAMGEALAPSVFVANLLTSITDKLLTGFIALAAISVSGLVPSGAVAAITGRTPVVRSASRRDEARSDAALPV